MLGIRCRQRALNRRTYGLIDLLPSTGGWSTPRVRCLRLNAGPLYTSLPIRHYSTLHSISSTGECLRDPFSTASNHDAFLDLRAMGTLLQTIIAVLHSWKNKTYTVSVRLGCCRNCFLSSPERGLVRLFHYRFSGVCRYFPHFPTYCSFCS